MSRYSKVTGKKIEYIITARYFNGYQFRIVVDADNSSEAKQIVLDMPETMCVINYEYL